MQGVHELAQDMKFCPEIKANFSKCMFSLFFVFYERLYELFIRTGDTVMSAAGCMSDVVTLRRMLDARLTQ